MTKEKKFTYNKSKLYYGVIIHCLIYSIRNIGRETKYFHDLMHAVSEIKVLRLSSALSILEYP